MSDDELHALSGAYALDAVDDVERARFESHLAECAECRAEVASLTSTAGELAAMAGSMPPPSLKAAVLHDIRSVRPLPPVVGEQRPAKDAALGSAVAPQAPGPLSPVAPAPSDTPVAAPAPARQDPPTVTRLDDVRRRRSVSTWLVGVAAAALVAFTGLVWQPWATDTSRLSQTEQVLQAPDAQRYAQDIGGATATIVRSESLARAVIVTEDMPPPPAGKVYEVWLQHADGKMVKAALMPTVAAQRATVPLDGDAAVAVGAGITLEPAGGSVQPTSEPLVLFAFA